MLAGMTWSLKAYPDGPQVSLRTAGAGYNQPSSVTGTDGTDNRLLYLLALTAERQ